MVKLRLEELTEESDSKYRIFSGKEREISVSFDYGVLNDNRIFLYINGTPFGSVRKDNIDEDEEKIQEILLQ